MITPPAVVSLLAGAWLLVNQTTTYDNGTVTLPSPSGTGPNPIGLLQYTTTGYVAANIMSSNPADKPMNIHWPSQANDSTLDSDWAKLAHHTLSYAGVFSVNHVWNETHGQLEHGPFIFAWVPSVVNSSGPRNYTFLDEFNTLKITTRNESQASTGCLLWRRAAPSWK